MKRSTQTFLNCLICLFQSKYNIFEVIFPVKGHCLHRNENVTKPHFQISKFWICFGALYTTFLVIPAISYCYYLPEICTKNTFVCLILSADEIFGVTSITVCLVTLGTLKITKHERNLWLRLFENRKLFYVNRITSGEIFKKLKYSSKVWFLIHSVLLVFVMLQDYFFSYNNFSIQYIRRFAKIGYYGSQSYYLFQVLQSINFVGFLLEALEDLLKISLCNKLVLRRDILNRSQELIEIINQNVYLIMKHLPYTCVVWILTSVASLILNIYILVKHHDSDLTILSMLQFRTGIIVFGILLLLYNVESRWNHKVSAFLSKMCCLQLLITSYCLI